MPDQPKTVRPERTGGMTMSVDELQMCIRDRATGAHQNRSFGHATLLFYTAFGDLSIENQRKPENPPKNLCPGPIRTGPGRRKRKAPARPGPDVYKRQAHHRAGKEGHGNDRDGRPQGLGTPAGHQPFRRHAPAGRPTISIISMAFFSRSMVGTPRISSPKATLPITLRWFIRPKF